MNDELIRIELYESVKGKYPFEKWFKGLKDRKAKAAITIIKKKAAEVSLRR